MRAAVLLLLSALVGSVHAQQFRHGDPMRASCDRRDVAYNYCEQERATALSWLRVRQFNADQNMFVGEPQALACDPKKEFFTQCQFARADYHQTMVRLLDAWVAKMKRTLSDLDREVQIRAAHLKALREIDPNAALPPGR